MADISGGDRPELADAGRLARKLVGRAVRMARTEDQPLRQVLLDHLGPEAARLPTISGSYPLWEHVNLQVGVESWLAASPDRTHELIGISGVGQLRFNDLSIGALVQARPGGQYGAAAVSAAITTALPCGPGGQTRGCVSNGIYLVRDGEDRFALMLLPSGIGPQQEVTLQVVGADQGHVERVLAEVRRLAVERSVFRGQVISFGPELFGMAGASTPLNFLSRPSVRRDQVVLPDELLDQIEGQVLGIARHAGRLLASGQHLKRGILLYGAPGAGKTHTVNYLLGRLPQATVIVISGRALGRITEACSVARTLQPSVVVVEDVDLIAEERGSRDGQHPLLFQLLNEMDGLAPDADVTFLLTTNRADLLEPALAERPGRVDHAALLPLPDAAARGRLLRLYQGNLRVSRSGRDKVVARTEGMTAAFLKELLRRAALRAATGSAADGARARLRVTDEHLTAALDELLDTHNDLTRVLLGGAQHGRRPGPRRDSTAMGADVIIPARRAPPPGWPLRRS